MKIKDLLAYCSVDLYTLERISEKTAAPGRAVAAMMKLMRFSSGEKVTERDLATLRAARLLEHRDDLRKYIQENGPVKGMSDSTVMSVYHLCDAIETQANSVCRQVKSLEDISPGGLFIPRRKCKVTTERLNTWLVAQTKTLLKAASDERKLVFKSFFGVEGPAKTQSETGHAFDKPVTGERVRRVMNDALSRFVMPFNQGDMVNCVLRMKVVDYDLAPFFALFYDRKGALRCLEYILDLNKGHLCGVELPKIPSSVIYHVAGATGNRFTVEDVVNEIRRQGKMKGVPDGALPMVVEKGDNELISQDEAGLYSASPLPDPYYAAAILYHYPEGVSVNAMAMQSANELDKRVGRATGKPYWANVLVRASTAGLAAISEPGYYKHIRFFGDAIQDTEVVLNKTKQYLQTLGGDGSVSLVHDVVPKLFPDMDYAGIRYIISHFGESKGIYFKGTSSIDMVSLNPAVPVMDLDEEVKAVLSKRRGPLSRDEISDAIWGNNEEYRRSAYHVIARLEETDDIVRVGKGLYQSVDAAFDDIDIDQVADAVIDVVTLMGEQDLNIDLYALNAHVNEEVLPDRVLPPLWVAGLLKFHSKYFAGKVDVAHNVAAKTGRQIRSVNDIGQQLLDENPTFKSADFVDAMQQLIVIEPKQAAVAYNYLHRKRA